MRLVLFQLADVVSQSNGSDDTDQEYDAESGQGFEGGVGVHRAPFAENMGKKAWMRGKSRVHLQPHLGYMWLKLIGITDSGSYMPIINWIHWAGH